MKQGTLKALGAITLGAAALAAGAGSASAAIPMPVPVPSGHGFDGEFTGKFTHKEHGKKSGTARRANGGNAGLIGGLPVGQFTRAMPGAPVPTAQIPF
ncbi:hypothetical protein [Streptomyces palmae]|uniref:Uncharacterized protein n=1 Tax=Streptomyces palmae TaxID=1701085 RepID=A0A4Z0GKQ2_9ACTN|nr:hypothetical protein [Streptomyces palmae]TGA96566.1 hypothetical protein E4099_24085 [Streptomyces palmae]